MKKQLRVLTSLLLSFTLISPTFAGVWDATEKFDYEAASEELYSPDDETTEGETIEGDEVVDCSILKETEKAAIRKIPNEISVFSADMKLQDELIKEVNSRGGKWAFEFKWIPKDGFSVVLDAYNEKQAMIPASIMKLFTGWMAYNQEEKKDKFLKDTYLSHMLRNSDNYQAKTVFDGLGGVERMKPYYTVYNWFGIFDPVDGAGLCVTNKITAHVMNMHLHYISYSKKYDGFKKLLAQPANPGTLSSRLVNLNGKLFAKTGTMKDSAIVSLAGFYEHKKGTLVFTVIVNAMRGKPRVVRSYVDSLIVRHVLYIDKNFN